MSRSSRRRGRRRSASRSTARATGAPNLVATPDGRRELSDGLLVEASVVARLLRVRLLEIDVSLAVSPARVSGRAPAAARPRPQTAAIGAGLAAAERSLSEGAASLAATRPGR